MITTPTSFTHENLSSLKFKELQKLSAQFHVNKRWAKKQELIENLLALGEKVKAANDNKQEDERQWKDGGTIFSDLNFNSENEVNRRITFNIDAKHKADGTVTNAPFQLLQDDRALLCETINSRETYDIPPSKIDLDVELLTESRATFDIPPKASLIPEVDPRATFDVPQNGKKLVDESKLNKENSNHKNLTNSQTKIKIVPDSDLKEELGKVKFGINVKNGDDMKEDMKTKSHVKMLTIPYARVTRRTKKDGEASKNDNLPIKMSKKSINIKKSTRLPVSKSDLVKSPAFSSVKKSINKQSLVESITKTQTGGGMRSRVPVRLQFTEEKPKADVLENPKKILRRRISKAGDEAFQKKTTSARVNFRTPPAAIMKNPKEIIQLKKTPVLKDTNGRLNSNSTQTPAGKPTVTTKATKMPDFSKIHKRQFEQMDSLHDYIKKKEERIRKLFGTPQPGQQLQIHNKSAPLFRFQSGSVDKGNREKENFNNVVTPSKRKEHDSKSAQKEAFKSKLPPSKLQTDIKDKNRSHIHGVRTNKRFELQMKLRNM